MEQNLKNNLFNYATSELSQDAFLCYLLSFAYEDYYDPILTPCAKGLIHLFVEEIDDNDLELIEIRKQYPIIIPKEDGRRSQKRAIDILLTVQYRDVCYKIIIEDKTFTSEHDNQLKEYKKWVVDEFPYCCVKGVYYKTGFQSNMENIADAEYRIIGREEMIAYLEKYIEKTDNLIVRDYYLFWRAFQNEADLFRSLPPINWTWKQIYGFYDDLQSSITNIPVGYGDVSNPAGGFIGFWTKAQDCDTIYFKDVGLNLYLQIEAAEKESTTLKICLKMATKADNETSENLTSARNMLIYQGKAEYRFTEYGFDRPEKIYPGKYMTVGVMNKDYKSAEEVKMAFLDAVQRMKKIISDLITKVSI